MGETERDDGNGQQSSFEFIFNGRTVRARAGDSIAVALVRSGVHVFSRSLKFHRPRGLYCGAGNCFSCAMRVNGVPGVRTCSTKAEKGMLVESEGGIPSTRFDLLSAFDFVFRDQFDYHSRFIRPRFMVPAYQRLVRWFASPRRLPDGPGTYRALEDTSTDVLVIGHGISGGAACDRLRSLGIAHIVADRRGDGSSTPSFAFGYYEDGRVGIVSEDGGRIASAKTILLAVGCIETGLDLVNADLPGVLLPEALAHLAERNVRPGRSVFIIGDEGCNEEVLRNIEALGCTTAGRCVDPTKVVRIVGGTHVEAVEFADDQGRLHRVKCDSAVILGHRVPYVNLAQQAGCELSSCGQFWRVKTDHGGRTSVPSVFSCGSAAGFSSEDERRASGIRAAESIAGYLAVL